MNLSYRHMFDMGFGRMIPFMSKFVLPGDVWRVGANCLIRYQPLFAPPLSKANARLRYFFVPLRLVEEDTEKIITGSDNGKLIETTLPEFKGIFSEVTSSGNYTVAKNSIMDYLGMPCLDYTSIKDDKSIPALYWLKGILRCWFDYYRDENLNSDSDFDTWLATLLPQGGQLMPLSVNLRKDYFTSSLPWQLKGATPSFSITATGNIDYTDAIPDPSEYSSSSSYTFSGIHTTTGEDVFVPRVNGGTTTQPSSIPDMINLLNSGKIDINAGTFNMDDLRTMAAQTRVFERLARCGSRYTEYLKSNFNGIAPSDGTLQRAQYLGGFKQPIVTTEVVQTAEDGTTPVGTLRGHGISSSSNTIKPHMFKEFGMIFGFIDIVPDLAYTQGINRELTYKSRFDFFNPSFQHLSEQEVRNGELYIDNSDGKNDETFGFQAIYNELRSSQDKISGELRGNLNTWTQAITFASRPNLNESFIQALSYESDFMRPFAVQSGSNPIIVDLFNNLDVYRPMVKYGTPGLIDHL
nr:MAG: major capsid protein [Microviridae sp.]